RLRALMSLGKPSYRGPGTRMVATRCRGSGHGVTPKPPDPVTYCRGCAGRVVSEGHRWWRESSPAEHSRGDSAGLRAGACRCRVAAAGADASAVLGRGCRAGPSAGHRGPVAAAGGVIGTGVRAAVRPTRDGEDHAGEPGVAEQTGSLRGALRALLWSEGSARCDRGGTSTPRVRRP